MSWWVRLWMDMPSDPKWRLIAEDSGRTISEVIAVFNFMMICAGTNETNVTNVREHSYERGELKNWNDRLCAFALDLETQNVTDIRCAMENIVIENRILLGWEKRQPLREDRTSAERAKRWREKQRALRNGTERSRTAQYAPDTDTDTDTDTDKKPPSVVTRAGAREPRRVKKKYQGKANGYRGPITAFNRPSLRDAILKSEEEIREARERYLTAKAICDGHGTEQKT